jgi:hypothetical protein
MLGCRDDDYAFSTHQSLGKVQTNVPDEKLFFALARELHNMPTNMRLFE